ncbi:MAG: molybdopterin-binding protein, partial [Chloroflexota bacterium]
DAVVAALAVQADLLVTTGGVSVGAHDHVGAALATHFELVVWRLAIQPGKPLLLGRRHPSREGALWAIGLPGNPVSAFVVGIEVALPLLRALGGRPARGQVDVGLLEERVESPLGRRSFLRLAALRDEGGAPLRDHAGRVRVRLAGEQGSHQVSVLARTDYLGVVPEEIGEYAAGEEIALHPLPRASRRITAPNG